MVEIFDKSINRRNFLKTTLASAGLLVTGCASLGPESRLRPGTETSWAFLADTHIPADTNDSYRSFRPYHNLQKVVSEMVSYSLDGVAIAGDLARLKGQPGDYANLKVLLKPIAEQTPVFMALGNHDDRQNFLKVFNQVTGERQSVPGKHVVVVNQPPVRLIVLDSLLYVNKVPGLLGKAQRRWLQEYLNKSDNTPTILCFHHTLKDGDGDLLDVPRLFDMIKSIRKVKAVVYGHSHEYQLSRFKGIHLINLPAVGYNFSDVQPVGWIEARLTARGGDFILHAIAGDKEKDGSVKSLTWRT